MDKISSSESLQENQVERLTEWIVVRVHDLFFDLVLGWKQPTNRTIYSCQNTIMHIRSHQKLCSKNWVFWCALFVANRICPY